MKQEDERVGCSVIRGMRKEIADMKRSRLPISPIAWAFCILGFIVALGFLGRTFWSPRLPEKIVYEIKLDNANGEKAYEAVIKKELAEALIAVEARAANDYNDKFITLLTVLTIFGIAWPLVVALAQYKFNERELDKIQVAGKNAEKALAKATSASKDARIALDKTNEMIRIHKSAEARWWDMMAMIYDADIMKMSKRDKETKPKSELNFNFLMFVFCKCLRTQLAFDNQWMLRDITTVKDTIFAVAPEDEADNTSKINKLIANNVKNMLKKSLEIPQGAQINELLLMAVNKVSAISDVYIQLVPNAAEADHNV